MFCSQRRFHNYETEYVAPVAVLCSYCLFSASSLFLTSLLFLASSLFLTPFFSCKL